MGRAATSHRSSPTSDLNCAFSEVQQAQSTTVSGPVSEILGRRLGQSFLGQCCRVHFRSPRLTPGRNGCRAECYRQFYSAVGRVQSHWDLRYATSWVFQENLHHPACHCPPSLLYYTTKRAFPFFFFFGEGGKVLKEMKYSDCRGWKKLSDKLHLTHCCWWGWDGWDGVGCVCCGHSLGPTHL